MTNEEKNPSESDYYSLNLKRFIDWFLEYTEPMLSILTKNLPIKVAGEICAEARIEFEKMLPNLPYIGGDQNQGTKWILLSAAWVSFYRPLNKRGTSTEDIGRILYDAYVEDLAATPEEEYQKRGAARFSETYIAGFKSWTESDAKRFEKDFVITFVDGEGRDFDYGADYHFCPCADIFKEQGASKLAPYFCQVDFPEHKLMGTGLVRHKTLAQGDDICDFRFKKNREIRQDWSTEVPKFQSK